MSDKILGKKIRADFCLESQRYTKRFDVWVYLVVMLYAVIMRFDSLREITASLLADTNRRHPERIFEEIYRQLYGRYRHVLSPGSRSL